jgi:hypothetical protein
MPRQNRRRREEPAATDAAAIGRGAARRVDGPDGGWYVRPVTGAAATKSYRCPGCDQEIRPATAHLVVWPDDGSEAVLSAAGGSGLGDRRHWHSVCWNARDRRAPRVLRGRGAPRY